MVIDPNNINNAANAGAKTKLAAGDRASVSKPSTEAASKQTTSADSVSLSSAAQSLGKLEAAVNQAPDTNSAKVSALKAAVQSGQYQVDPEAIANKMLEQEN